ncbi:MAG: hypothetical protein LBU45_06630 [Azoarcus sp.]|jgi:tetratricopeptide (TPR) repeat protein|nr:hypothetical protein [Azoarcus sp.]
MDIWKWVEKLTDDLNQAGQSASARILDELPGYICELEMERAEALIPEARALARSLENPWLEVFVGHWEMRNRLGNKYEGESALPDVISLFERAHRPDAIDCPQSVCVTQDLADCYSNIDAIGWAPECRAVVEETLQRIDPCWPCFDCLCEDYLNTFLAEGRHEEGIAWLEAQQAKVREAGSDREKYSLDELELWRCNFLLELGRAEEALAILDAQAADTEMLEDEAKKDRVRRLLRYADALSRLGRDEEAWEKLPDWNDTGWLRKTNWIRIAARLLSRDPSRNTWQFGSEMQEVLDHLSRHGTHRPLIDCAQDVARLAIQRKAPWSAARVLRLARAHQKKLRADGNAEQALSALERELADLPVEPLPVPAEQLLEWLQAREERDPEKEVQWLLEAHAQRPDDPALVECAANALLACSAREEAENLLWRFIQARPQAGDGTPFYDVAVKLLDVCADRGQNERAEALACLYDPIERPFALWCRATLAKREENWPRVTALTQEALSLAPQRISLMHLLAAALRQQKRFAEAAAVWAQAIETLDDRQEACGDELWHHMTSACAAGDWKAVRKTAARLDMEVEPGEGPIDEDWCWILIHYEEDGETYYARRTGPVTARIVENAINDDAQRVLDEIVFDAGSGCLESPPEDEAERQEFVYTYRFLHTLKPGGFGAGWQVAGVHPGEEQWKALFERLEEPGYQVWVHANGHEVTDSETGETLKGILFSIAAPVGVSPQALHAFLEECTRGLAHPFCWPRLASACNADTAPHEAIIERYDL